MARLEEITREALQEMIQLAISDAAQTAAVSRNKSRGSLANCPTRFGGQNSHEAVEEFITNVEIYKELEGISNDDALKGLALLFYDLASTWWQGARKDAKTWEAAIALIREHFSPQKTAPQIYMEFFEKKQNNQTNIGEFVVQKRALLAQLPDERHSEEVELDMLYGLLHIKYRKHITRSDVKSFNELLDKARSIEQIETEAEAEATQNVSNKRIKRCTHCNFRGHTFQDCRKRKQAKNAETGENNSKD